jgi:hypothetical protein
LPRSCFFITDVDAVGLPIAQGVLLTEAFYWDLNHATRTWSSRFAARNGGRMRSERLFLRRCLLPWPRHTFLVGPRTITDKGWPAGPWAFLLPNGTDVKKQPFR